MPISPAVKQFIEKIKMSEAKCDEITNDPKFLSISQNDNNNAEDLLIAEHQKV